MFKKKKKKFKRNIRLNKKHRDTHIHIHINRHFYILIHNVHIRTIFPEQKVALRITYRTMLRVDHFCTPNAHHLMWQIERRWCLRCTNGVTIPFWTLQSFLEKSLSFFAISREKKKKKVAHQSIWVIYQWLSRHEPFNFHIQKSKSNKKQYRNHFRREMDPTPEHATLRAQSTLSRKLKASSHPLRLRDPYIQLITPPSAKNSSRSQPRKTGPTSPSQNQPSIPLLSFRRRPISLSLNHWSSNRSQPWTSTTTTWTPSFVAVAAVTRRHSSSSSSVSASSSTPSYTIPWGPCTRRVRASPSPHMDSSSRPQRTPPPSLQPPPPPSASPPSPKPTFFSPLEAVASGSPAPETPAQSAASSSPGLSIKAVT